MTKLDEILDEECLYKLCMPDIQSAMRKYAEFCCKRQLELCADRFAVKKFKQIILSSPLYKEEDGKQV